MFAKLRNNKLFGVSLKLFRLWSADSAACKHTKMPFAIANADAQQQK